MSEILLSFDRVSRVFSAGRVGLPRGSAARRRAVDEVSLAVRAGETYALVGESGCGKTTLARMGVALLRPTSGRVSFRGEDVGRLRGGRLRIFRRRVRIVFQNPAGALDPRQRVGSAVEEPLLLHRWGTAPERRREVARLLEMVGLGEREGRLFPHQLSGGQKQRALIARALAPRPALVLLDEPVSALDVSVRAQILNLLAGIQRENALSYLLISHDIGVVRHAADRVGVIHEGRLVEEGPAARVLGTPAHPYTVELLRAVPVPDPKARPAPPAIPPGDPGGRATGEGGCHYAGVCLAAGRLCRRRRPLFRPFEGASGHFVACHEAG